MRNRARQPWCDADRWLSHRLQNSGTITMKRIIAAFTILGVLAGCSTTSPDVIQRGDAQRLSQVQDATVLSVRPVTVDGSQSGIGGQLGNQGFLQMHDLVVRQRQDEGFSMRVGQAEGDVGVMPATLRVIAREVLQGVVHPAHVPLVRKAEARGRGDVGVMPATLRVIA
eukprot:gene49564-67304_t